MAEEENTSLLTPSTVGIAAAVGIGAYYLLSGSGEDARKLKVQTEEELSGYEEGIFSVWDRHAKRTTQYSKKGIASEKAVTLIDAFQECLMKNPKKVAWRREINNNTGWEECTYEKHYRNSTRMAKALMAAGVGARDTVSIIGFNSYQWITANMGCILAGGIGAGMYTSNNSGQIKYIVNHCKAKIVFVENKKQLKKFESIQTEVQNIKFYVIWDENDVKDLKDEKNTFGVPVFSYDEFLATFADKTTDEELKNRQAAIEPEHCCTLIYTSGTTGNPKAVMMSHDNLTFTAKALFHSLALPDMQHSVISYLPLSHIAAQIVDMHFPIYHTSVKRGFSTMVTFARPDALKGSIKGTMVSSKPTIFFGVPRVWEKFKAAILAKSAKVKKGAVLQGIIDWAKNVNYTRNNSLNQSEKTTTPFGYGLASKLVGGKVKEALGLQNCKVFMTGAAPIAKETLDWFKCMDIFLDEVYGMSECAGPISVGRLYHRETGTTGPPLDGAAIKLDFVEGRDKPNEGEICFRGRSIMMGYLDQEKKTREAIDAEGWLHSGDVGKFSHRCVGITGRIKELIITAGGENIAPVPIEHYIKAEAPALANVIMIGDRKKYNTCLVSLKCVMDGGSFGNPTNELDAEAITVSDAKTVDEAMKDKKWQEYITNAITKYNNDTTACASRAQKIQYFRILPEDLSVPAGTLGPTLKLKRSVVCKVYADLVETMYSK